VEWKLIKENPVVGVKKPVVRHKELMRKRFKNYFSLCRTSIGE